MIMDSYKTVSSVAKAKTVIKKSTFLSFIHPIANAEQVEELLRQYRKEYYDARHICYAYIIGTDKRESKSSDNGEPSGTAGRPMLGVLMSAEITNVLVVVIRYFGGIKLGTPGLIAAYKESTEAVLQSAEIIMRTEELQLSFSFDYAMMNQVMKLLKHYDVKIIENNVDLKCHIVISAAKSVIEAIKEPLKKITEIIE